MGNVFRRFGVLSVALIVCGACSGAPEDDATGDGPEPYSGNADAPGAPGATTPPPNTNPAPTNPTPPVTPQNTETPAAGVNTPLVPGATPPAQPPPVAETPPVTPPAETPPPETPPAETPPAETPPAAARTQVFLLFGQSNMWGVPNPTQQDMEINPRVEVLTFTACGRHGNNQWVPAQPPLHGCVGQIGTGTMGPGVGPGDYFAKAIAEAFPQDTILLVPAAVPGVSINTFQPGQQNYNNLLSRARMAQQRGEISGMIFHQGESDSGRPDEATWPTRVKTVVDRLRSDLGLGNVPFVAGELPEGGCCGGFNRIIAQLPSTIPGARVVLSDGLAELPDDLHFTVDAQRTLGARYGEAMLDLLNP